VFREIDYKLLLYKSFRRSKYMSDKKVLTINPELFTFSTNKTKKSKPSEPKQDKIRIKTQINRKNDTLRRQSLLKMIRNHQEERYKRLFEENNKNKPDVSTNNHADTINKFNREFDGAREYLDKLTKKTEMNVPKNTTLRAYQNPNVLTNVNNSINNSSNNTYTQVNNPIDLTPSYGCLKNGSLPTYRNYMNKTQSNRPKITVGGDTPLISNVENMNVSNNIINKPTVLETIQNKPAIPISTMENKLYDGMKKISELKQQQGLTKTGIGGKPKKMKRKKTLRRTYKIGRSTVSPTVSVLVSNKTLRNRITTKSQLLKQTPIQEVKKYLIKQGIIRVGSITPNDVLRKMYESMVLICGEIKNHNPDTLLYNYINDTD
jgi:hypothetical protein